MKWTCNYNIREYTWYALYLHLKYTLLLMFNLKENLIAFFDEISFDDFIDERWFCEVEYAVNDCNWNKKTQNYVFQ